MVLQAAIHHLARCHVSIRNVGLWRMASWRMRWLHRWRHLGHRVSLLHRHHLMDWWLPRRHNHGWIYWIHGRMHTSPVWNLICYWMEVSTGWDLAFTSLSTHQFFVCNWLTNIGLCAIIKIFVDSRRLIRHKKRLIMWSCCHFGLLSDHIEFWTPLLIDSVSQKLRLLLGLIQCSRRLGSGHEQIGYLLIWIWSTVYWWFIHARDNGSFHFWLFGFNTGEVRFWRKLSVLNYFGWLYAAGVFVPKLWFSPHV